MEDNEPAFEAPTTKTLEVTKVGGKVFRITVPANARTTFGPWSPPPAGADRFSGGDKALVGTLRIYAPGGKATESVLAVFSGVEGFRDLSIEYTEQVLVEKGSVIWESDRSGYSREEKVKRDTQWDSSETKAIAAGEDDF